MIPLPIFIGFDSRETVAYHVLTHSILARASRPVSITPLALTHLAGVGYTRPRGETESTEFSISRFLVPWLCGYEGLAVYLDCDFLCRTDITALVEDVTPALHDDDAPAVWVCQHDYTPKTRRKFLGQPQLAYPRKNWSSLMVFNNARCQVLTPEFVSEAAGLVLHRFEWTPFIGSLPKEWNWLVGEYSKKPDVKMIHFTLGGPWFSEYRRVDYGEEWRAERQQMNRPAAGS